MSVHALKVHDYRRDPQKAVGAVILVDRLWPRGIAKRDLELNAWLRDAAPSADLRTWWKHDPERFEEFRARYCADLDDAVGGGGDVDELIEMARDGDITLLYAAKDRAVNHAVVLSEWLAHLIEE